MAILDMLASLRGERSSWLASAAERHEVPEGFDARPVHVMVSSPSALLQEERDALFKSIEGSGDLKSLLFDKLPDSGRTNIIESIDLALQCDIFIALMVPGEPGTHIKDEQLGVKEMAHLSGRYFSEIELEVAYSRTNEKTRLPLIHLYVKGNDSAKSKLDGWHLKYSNLIACKTFETTDQLVDMVMRDVLGNVIRLRTLRNRYLAEQLESRRRELERVTLGLTAKEEAIKSLRARLDDRDKDLTYRDAEAQRQRIQHAADLEAIGNREREVRGQMQAAHASAHEAILSDLKRLQNALAVRRRTTLQLVVIGAAMGAFPLLAYSALGGGFAGLIGSKMESALALVGTAFAQRPVQVSHVGADPMLLAKKIAIGTGLAGPVFDCLDSKPKRLPLEISGFGGVSTQLLTESVCSPFGDIQLELMLSGMSPCSHAPVINAELWKTIVEKTDLALKSNNVRNWGIAEVRLLGHASQEQIRGGCDFVPDELLINEAQANLLALADRKIVNNTQLAYIRALRQQREIELAFQQSGDRFRPQVVSETMGILSATRIPGDDRKVTVALRIARTD